MNKIVEKAIKAFGRADNRTTTIEILVELGKEQIAETLFNNLAEVEEELQETDLYQSDCEFFKATTAQPFYFCPRARTLEPEICEQIVNRIFFRDTKR